MPDSLEERSERVCASMFRKYSQGRQQQTIENAVPPWNLEFLQDYLIESRELLQKAQRDILGLEADPGNDEALASIFRAFHTIKGGAGFLDAGHVVSWAHDLEDLLDKLRSHTLPVTSDRIDAILNGIDVLGAMFQTLGEEQEPGPGPADLGRRIKMLAATESECGGSLAAFASAMTDAESPQAGGVPAAPAGAGTAISPTANDIHRSEFPVPEFGSPAGGSVPRSFPGVWKRLKTHCVWRQIGWTR